MHCISISHKMAPAHIRGLFSFSEEEQIEFGKQLLKKEEISGCVILSTCNRSELYFSGDKSAIPVIEKEMSRYKKTERNQMLKYFHVFSEEGALRHLFNVSCGADSMVLGEDEILRQVKEAYQLSLENNLTNNELNIAFQAAFNSSKSVKSNTNLSNTPVSIGTLTANGVIDFLKENQGTHVLIVGITGKMGSIVAKNLSGKAGVRIIGTSRNHNGSVPWLVKNSHIKMVKYEERYRYLEKADVVISVTGSPHYTFTNHDVSHYLKDNKKKKLFIDLSVPYDIDKEIADINGIEILDIDYFKQAADQNNLVKQKELDKVDQILNLRIDETMKSIDWNAFRGTWEKVKEKMHEDGLDSVFYHLRESLNSEQLRVVLEALQDMVKGEV